MENSMEIPQQIRNTTTTNDSAIPLLGIGRKKTKTPTWKDMCTPCLLQYYFQ